MLEVEHLNHLSREDICRFQSTGYIIVPDVYTHVEIFRAREIFDYLFRNQAWRDAPFSSPEIINDIYRIYPELADIIFNAKYISSLKDILGEEVVCVPESSLHCNRYFDWHKDSSQMEAEGSKEHWAGNEFMVQCCTYFQDNEPTGGGMTVIPGSHLTPDRFIQIYAQYARYPLYYKMLKILQVSPFHYIETNEPALRLPSKAGDLVILDIRLDHRATFLRRGNPFFKPTQGQKYAVFNAFAKPGKLPHEYLAKLKGGKGNYNRFLNQTTCAGVVIEKAKELDFKIYA